MSKEKPRREADLIEDELPGRERLGRMPIRTMEQLEHNRRKGPPVVRHRPSEWENPGEQSDVMRPLADLSRADQAFWDSLSNRRVQVGPSEHARAEAQYANEEFFRSLRQAR